jgi:NAD(P)-dependent dehydrogenase (short-subunit alcohol dehydrogenase family)
MKTVLITGGGRGLGRATAEKLASLGHRVVLTARDAAAGERAVAQIREAHPRAQVEARLLDLASLEQVRAFGDRTAAEGWALDVLFNCAGVLQQSRERRTTRDGFEETLAVNTLAPFLLTARLLPALKRSAEARVINVSSRLHLPNSRGTPVHFDFEDPQLLRGYDPERAYKNSKLALLWFTAELQRRLGPGPLTAHAVCPGFVPVTAAESTSGALRWLMRHVLPHLSFANSVETAVDAFVFMALDPSLAGNGGGFWGERHRLEASADARDEAKARRFWSLAEQLTQSGPWPTE